MFAFLLIFYFMASSIATETLESVKTYHNQSEVIDDVLDNAFQCMQELDISVDICSEMLMKDKDLSDKKYNNCKCFGPCIAKKIGTMNSETGKWNEAKFKELSTLMENEILKQEADIIYTHCKDDKNTHCEAGFALMKCVMEHSPMAKDMIKNYVASMESNNNSEEK